MGRHVKAEDNKSVGKFRGFKEPDEIGINEPDEIGLDEPNEIRPQYERRVNEHEPATAPTPANNMDNKRMVTIHAAEPLQTTNILLPKIPFLDIPPNLEPITLNNK